ncbi:uncharacterized protein LOC127467419 [Manacus candei]|uniref:uncharacterized protein LOC127467419 n=1 Tax=Manacus candei TaxID=415023 RepID=UPI0022265D5C|nr:uncharacterized protein LOC127467419 [Manacus candei]
MLEHRAPLPQEASRPHEAGGKGGSPAAGPRDRPDSPAPRRRKPPGRRPRPVLTVQVLLLGAHDLVGRGLAHGLGDGRTGHTVLRRRDAVGEALAGHGGFAGGAGTERGSAPSSGAGTGGVAGGMELRGLLTPPCRRRPPLRPQGRTCHPSRDPSSSSSSSSSRPPPPAAVPSPCAPARPGTGTRTGRRRKMAATELLLGPCRASPASRDRPAPRPVTRAAPPALRARDPLQGGILRLASLPMASPPSSIPFPGHAPLGRVDGPLFGFSAGSPLAMEFLECHQKKSNPDVDCACSVCQKWNQLSVVSRAAVRGGLKTKALEQAAQESGGISIRGSIQKVCGCGTLGTWFSGPGLIVGLYNLRSPFQPKPFCDSNQ